MTAVDVENYANFRSQGAPIYLLAKLAQVSATTAARALGTPPRHHGWPLKEVPALLERIFAYNPEPLGYISAMALAKHVGCSYAVMLKHLSLGTIKPDALGPDNRHLFRKDKIAEHVEKWNNRHEASPTSAREVVVITPFGMIRPRAEPDVRALAPLLLLKPRRHSRPGSSTREPDYNLSDLFGSRSKQPSTPIFASTSLKGVRTPRGRKTRRRI